MADFHAVIIGGGPRCVTLMERFATLGHSRSTDSSLLITIIDPGDIGSGVHYSSQPDCLWTNTLASQVTIWPGGQYSSATCGDVNQGLLDWAAQRGYKKTHNGRVVFDGQTGVLLTDGDYLPRQLLGQYLCAMADTLRERLPSGISIRHFRDYAIDVQVVENGYVVILKSGAKLQADFVIIAYGHGTRTPVAEDQTMTEAAAAHHKTNPRLSFYQTPYPIETLDAISSDTMVGVIGMGLTCHDVVAALTIRRGGRYESTPDGLQYVPSGREPKIYLASRETLPFAARAINQKGRTGRHSAVFFTPQRVKELQEQVKSSDGRRLDFLRDLWPILRREMAYAFRAAEENSFISADTFEPSIAEIERIEDELWPLRHNKLSSKLEHRKWFLEKFADDLAEAKRGNLTSGIKAATDVMRDCREAFRIAVEFGRLEPDSHRYFASDFNAIINRVSFGPPLRRNEEFLALFQAGVIDLAGGPNTSVGFDADRAQFRISAMFGEETSSTWVDALILARLDVYSPSNDAREISRNLLLRGLIVPFTNGEFHPSGIAIDRSLKVQTADGSTAQRMWALGCVVEGPHYYTHALPRTGLASRQTADAHVIVEDIFKQMDVHQATLALAAHQSGAPHLSFL